MIFIRSRAVSVTRSLMNYCVKEVITIKEINVIKNF